MKAGTAENELKNEPIKVFVVEKHTFSLEKPEKNIKQLVSSRTRQSEARRHVTPILKYGLQS